MSAKHGAEPGTQHAKNFPMMPRIVERAKRPPRPQQALCLTAMPVQAAVRWVLRKKRLCAQTLQSNFCPSRPGGRHPGPRGSSVSQFEYIVDALGLKAGFLGRLQLMIQLQDPSSLEPLGPFASAAAGPIQDPEPVRSFYPLAWGRHWRQK